jgi:hypothetical protein
MPENKKPFSLKSDKEKNPKRKRPVAYRSFLFVIYLLSYINLHKQFSYIEVYTTSLVHN